MTPYSDNHRKHVGFGLFLLIAGFGALYQAFMLYAFYFGSCDLVERFWMEDAPPQRCVEIPTMEGVLFRNDAQQFNQYGDINSAYEN